MSNDAKVTPIFKTVIVDNTVFVDESSFKAASLQAQIDFIAEKTKEALSVSVCAFPNVNLWNTQHLIDSYMKQPLLTLGALRASLPEAEDLEETLVSLEANLVLFAESLSTLREKLKGIYVFANVPSNFNFEDKFIVLKSRIRRTSNSGHFLVYNDIKALMNEAMKYWASSKTETLDLGRRVYQQHGTWHNTTITPTQVVIGCQRLERYELEQLAVKLGFNGQRFDGVTPLKRW